VALINIDGWLNLPEIRFSKTDPAQRFYQDAIRFEEMFRTLVSPLRANRSVEIEADFTEETATSYRRTKYVYRNVDVILLEGIFLLKRQFQHTYDFSIWIDCTFETALERAIDRSQEGLPPDQTVNAYNTIYFPAQSLHLEIDNPREAASVILPNDLRIQSV
jgi:uridine kinase